MPIHYCLVARDGGVAAEYAATSGKFSMIAQRLLEKISVDVDTRKTYAYESQNFHYLVSDSVVFLCMADLSVLHRVAYAFLEDISGRFHGTYSKQKDASAFSRVLKERMEYYSYDPEVDKITKVREQIDEVKGVMVQNIDKVLARGERIEDLVDATDGLAHTSFVYRKQSKKLKRKMWWKNWKCCIWFVVLLLLAGVAAFFAACNFSDNVPCPWDRPDDAPATTNSATTTGVTMNTTMPASTAAAGTTAVPPAVTTTAAAAATTRPTTTKATTTRTTTKAATTTRTTTKATTAPPTKPPKATTKAAAKTTTAVKATTQAVKTATAATKKPVTHATTVAAPTTPAPKTPPTKPAKTTTANSMT